MPHAILRALRHRSTPTLLPSTSTSQAPEQLDGLFIIPSIFITVPDEEGAHHWCALAGTATSLNASGSPSFDVPLPDFAALEETIDRLKRAGETPTFRRPGKRDEVVLPKKKYGNQNAHHYDHQNHQHQHIVHSHSNNGAGPGVGTKRPPRPKRPQTSPTTHQERAQVETETPSHRYAAGAHAADIVEVMEANATGRFTPTKVFRSLSKGRKQKRRPPPVFTSISYESVVAQPFSPPAQYGSLPRPPTPASGSKRQKRNSLGWLFSSKRASIPVMRQSVEVLGVLAEREDIASQQQPWTDDAAMEYDMPACFEEQDFDEPPPSPAETHESDLDKPLPPIPAALTEIFPEEVPAPVAESLNHTTSSEASVAEMQINDSVQVQVVMAMNDAFRDVDFPLSQPRTPPANETTTNISGNTSAVLSNTVEKEKKVKRKFSLKRLRERFLSGPTAPGAQDVPPIPDLPPSILVLPSIGPIDPPFTPPSFPIDPPFTPPSLSIDRPFTPPPLPVFVLSPPPPAVSVTRSEERIADAKMIETTRADSPSLPPLDEDSNISTSSEDSSSSSAAVSNTLSSPDSTPPDTPDSVRVDPVFGLLKENDAREPKSEVKDTLDPELEVEIAAVDTGITRSAGMRRQLDSLRFNETHMVAVVV